MSKHFSKKELMCRCGCGLYNPQPQLLRLAEKVREILGVPMVVTCGCRCPAHNAAVGGEPHSRHLYGQAMDFRCAREPLTVYHALIEAHEDGRLPELGGLGVYDWGVHIDTYAKRPGYLRLWDRRTR